MLDALQTKAAAQKLKINVWQELIKEVKIPEKYKLIFIPVASFGLITDPQEARHALKKFYDLLEPEGKLVFEVETLKAVPAQLNVWRGSMYPRADGKFILAHFLDLPPQDNIGRTICRYELVDGNAIIKTEIEILKVRLYEPDDLYQLLIETGFTNIKMIKAFDRNKKPDQDDEMIVYECEK